MQVLTQIIDGEFHFSLHLVVLLLLVVVATIVDVRERRIPNSLVITGIVVGCAFHAIAPHGAGITFALAGVGVGIAALLPAYVLRAMGAGDVKLMGMIGAFLGTAGVIGTVLATMAAGGVIALGITAFKRMLPQLLTNLRNIFIQYHIRQMGGALSGPTPPHSSVGKMPYAIAICAGTLIQLFILPY